MNDVMCCAVSVRNQASEKHRGQVGLLCKKIEMSTGMAYGYGQGLQGKGRDRE